MFLEPLSENFASNSQVYNQINTNNLLDTNTLDLLGIKAFEGMGGSDREIAFIDPTVPNYQALLEGLHPGIQFIVLDANKDGVQQITDALTDGKYSAVHIVSHGSSGSIGIGSSYLGDDNIAEYAGELQQWRDALTPDADILLYGCEVAIPSGIFLEQLSQLTGADIAASDDFTGGAALGGDWDLEVKTGKIEAAIAFNTNITNTYNGILNNEFVWTKAMGSSASDEARSIVVDSAGNVYTVGFFSDTVDFDPGSGTFNLTSKGSDDIFISKLNSDGNFVWAKQFGGSDSDRGNSIAIDNAGNIYTTGYFSGTVDFDPGNNTFDLTSQAGSNTFISKLDNDGNFIWAKAFRGNATTSSHSIAVDSLGNVYTTGSFWNQVDFDPGSDIFELTSKGNNDIFVSKLNSDGNFVWAKAMGGTNYDQVAGIAVDSGGNVYTTGLFMGTPDFDPGSNNFDLIANGTYDIFVSKLNSDGSFGWAKQFGGSDAEFGYAIAVDSASNVYTTGSLRGTVDFDPGSGTFNLGSGTFVSKLNSDGNFVWAKQLGNSNSTGNSIAVDNSGSVYTAGSFDGIGDFDPGSSDFILTGIGDNDIFISKLNSDGSFAGAGHVGGNITQRAYDIAVDNSGNVYTTGFFQGTVDFNPGEGIFNLTAVGNSRADIFASKWAGVPVVAPVPNVSISSMSNPSIPEGASSRFRISRNSNAGGNLTVKLTLDPTSTAQASDYSVFGNNVTVSGNNVTVMIPNGQRFIDLTLIANQDGQIAEAAETLKLNLVSDPTYSIDAINNTTIATIATNGTFVNNTNDSGEGSLRQAILNANAFWGTDTIRFNIPGAGVQAIAPLSALPTITESVRIEGNSQPGFSGTPLIELNGSNAGNARGLDINANGSLVQGLIINSFALEGIKLGGDNNTIVGNYIGTNGTGNAAARNNWGIAINGAYNTIGGINPFERNLISGNNFGIFIGGNNAIANRVIGNYIGTDVTGNFDLGNTADGINIQSRDNMIGGTTPSMGNVISGNDHNGIYIEQLGSNFNQVLGNYIGTNAAGTADLGNTQNGIAIALSSNNRIGGNISGSRNIISGNNGAGIFIAGMFARGNFVQGNYIGTDVTGRVNLGNTGDGVRIEDGGYNTIGGRGMNGDRNIISGNSGYGVFISGTNATNNFIQGNYIGTDVTGNANLGNTQDGVRIQNSGNNFVGSDSVNGDRNIISGNLRYGVSISGSNATNNTIQGNDIGLKADGTSLGNNSHGILIDAAASNNNIGSGFRPEDRNAIAYNGGAGVRVVSSSRNNRISFNSIYSNNDLGIDLGATGLTPNDPEDADTDTNLLQNFPELTAATRNSNSVDITYKISSLPGNSSYPITVEFFLSDGAGEGKTFLGLDTYSIPNNNKTISLGLEIPVNIGDKIVATARDNNGNTSEFSIEQVVRPPNTAPILDLNGGASGINYTTTFTRGGGAVAISDRNNLTLTDDGNTINSATVRITNLLNGASEVLSAVTTNTNITATYNNGILTLSGSDTVANYQQVLRTVTYNNTAVIPNTTSRNIEFVVSDGSLNSGVATTTLAINMPAPISVGNITGTASRLPIASVNDTARDALYQFSVSANSRLVAELVNAGGNADLALYDINGNLLASSTNTGTLNDRIDFSTLSLGSYYIRVYQASPGQSVSYRLRMNAIAV